MPGAPNCSKRPNPKQSARMKAKWKTMKRKLAEYEKIKRDA